MTKAFIVDQLRVKFYYISLCSTSVCNFTYRIFNYQKCAVVIGILNTSERGLDHSFFFEETMETINQYILKLKLYVCFVLPFIIYVAPVL